ncbi:MAG: UDP-3-O-(3-hydroxymyristoyl)glucosamine N-acyltransferase [Gammaproteobacteria bacterium]
MKITLSQIQQQMGGELQGDGGEIIQGVNSLALAGSGDLAFAESLKFVEQARQSRASALIVPKDFPELTDRNCLRVDRPRQTFIGIMMLFDTGGTKIVGVHPSAIIGGHTVLAEAVAVGENAVIRDGVRIGAGTCIEAGVFIDRDVSIGALCRIGPNVTIRHGVRIADRVVIHAGTVIGGEGFGYFWDGKQQKKVPQLGGVQIDDDVEIGCNVCIDRATFGVTRVRQGAKIDNLVQIAHNNDIGAHSIIVSQVGLSGSVTLGERVTLAGQVGVADHITIGAGATAAARTGVSKDIKPGEVSWGAPNRPIKQVMREMASIARLPKLIEQVKLLSTRLKALEAKLERL